MICDWLRNTLRFALFPRMFDHDERRTHIELSCAGPLLGARKDAWKQAAGEVTDGGNDRPVPIWCSMLFGEAMFGLMSHGRRHRCDLRICFNIAQRRRRARLPGSMGVMGDMAGGASLARPSSRNCTDVDTQARALTDDSIVLWPLTVIANWGGSLAL